MEKSLNKQLEVSFKENWNKPALSDYKGVTLYYRDVARRIAKLHIVFEQCGLQKGDRVALCSKNQANWGVVFLATITYGAVAVPILHDFKPGNIHYVVNHSDPKILFVGNSVWEQLNEAEMPNIHAIIQLSDFSILYSRNPLINETRERLNEYFGKKYPRNFREDHLSFYNESPEEVAVISYTSGTTGFSKGVMLPFRSLWSNVMFAKEVHPHVNSTSNGVAMLPTAHMYGLLFDFLFEMCVGAHVHFLTRVPSPKIIMEAFAEIKPDVIVAVPLIIEKIYKKKLKPIINKTAIRIFLKLPVLDQKIQRKILNELINTFGGKFKEVIIGGAAFNREAEAFFRKIGFPFTVGYGMSECAPIITYSPWDNTRLYSCGKVAPRMEIRIDSPDPLNTPGEIQCKGDNVMLGYFKNPASTEASFTRDGWLKTGDMGVMDQDGFLYIRGRSKSMILGPSGQNIYPEEIESIINNMPYVVESLVIDEEGSLIALVYPDLEQAESDGLHNIEERIRENISLVNEELPNYCKIVNFRIFPEEFEKTPKRSIKRYLYQRTEL